MVLASIIMPAYNAEAFIEAALMSALRQTEPRVEIIVVDDASADATLAIAARIAAADPRVRLLANVVNAGPGAARNRGLAVARGEFVTLLDADDLYAPQRIERLLGIAERTGADVVSDNILLCPDDDTGPPKLLIPPSRLAYVRVMSAAEFIEGDIAPRRARANYGFMQPMFRRSFLEAHGIRYREENRFGEDYLLSLDCLMRGACWWVTPDAMYRYRARSGTLTEVQSSADLDRIRRAEERFLQDCLREAANPDLTRALRRHKAAVERRFYYRAFADAVKAKAFRAAARTLFEHPSGFRYILLESLQQTPLVLAKAVRGGYLRAGPTAQSPPAH